MIPLVETLRIRLLFVSAIYRLPAPSMATPPGGFASCALVAGPPSPEKPAVPFHATVVIIPFAETLCTALKKSEMKRLPDASTASFSGLIGTLVAETPLGPGPQQVPTPATVVTIPFGATLRTRELPDNFGAAFGAIRASSDKAYRQLIARALTFYKSALFNPHWGEQMIFRTDNTLRLSMVIQGMTREQALAVWSPFMEWVRADPA